MNKTPWLMNSVRSTSVVEIAYLMSFHFCFHVFPEYSALISVVSQGAGWGLPTAIPCEDTSVASVQNQAFYLDAEQKPLEDRYTVIVNEGIKLYIVMDGHDSARAADFALKCLPDYLLASDLQGMWCHGCNFLTAFVGLTNRGSRVCQEIFSPP